MVEASVVAILTGKDKAVLRWSNIWWKMILKQMMYTSVCTLWDQNGATTGLVCGELLYMRIYFFIFLMRSLWKYYGSKIVMSDVQSSFQNSDGLALSSMGHKINIEII